MKIVLVGNITNLHDEGMKKIALRLYQTLQKSHEIMLFNPLKLSFRRIYELRMFNPDIIHYIPGPSIKSFILLKILSILTSPTKTVISAPLPYLSSKTHRLLPILTPSLVLSQSLKYNYFFNDLGIKSCFFPISGVDLDRFRPLDSKNRLKLRKKLGFKSDDYIILHVGHITLGRNLNALLPLLKIKKKDNKQLKIVIIGSPSTHPNTDIIDFLTSRGVIVLSHYISKIEEYYTISDVYFFPTLNERSCIQIPLSVLEAMAMNLAVISTRFGGLIDIFSEGDGFYFLEDINNFNEINEKFDELDRVRILTRQKINQYSWFRISSQLLKVYQFLVNYSRI